MAKFIFWGAWTITGLYLAAEVLTFLLIDYPFNYYEPEVVMEAWRLKEGLPIYLDPANGPLAGLYAPFSQIVGALFYWILPDKLIVFRLISFLSLIGISVLAWRKSSSRNLLQLLFALTLVFIWHQKLYHFEIQAKPDSLSVLLVILSLLALNRGLPHRQTLAFIAGGILTALAAFTKQTMLFVIIPIALALIIHRKWNPLLLYIAGTAVSIAALWLILPLWVGNHLYFYTLDLPGQFPISIGKLVTGSYELLGTFWMLPLLAIVYKKWKNGQWLFYDTMMLLALLFSWPVSVFTFAKGGGLPNAFQPFYMLLAVYLVSEIPLSNWLTHARAHLALQNRISFGYALAAIAVGFLLLDTAFVNPPGFITTMQYRLRAHSNYQELAGQLRQAEGSLYVPMDNYLSLKAGKPIWRSQKNELDFSIGGVAPATSYRDVPLRHRNVVTVNTEDWRNSAGLEKKLKQNSYTLKSSKKMNQGVTYNWWIKSN